MIVNFYKDLCAASEILNRHAEIAFDTETTGLYEKDRLFSLILSCDEKSFYLNFQCYPHEGVTACLDLKNPEIHAVIQKIFSYSKKRYFAHNAKFDLGMLAKENIFVEGEVFCTEAQGRVVKNNHIANRPYSLASSAARIGFKKDDTVEKYVADNGLNSRVTIDGKKTEDKLVHYDRVPFSIIAPYGVNDAVITLKLGRHLQDKISRDKEIKEVSNNEMLLTKTCFKMERRGILIDPLYTRKAWDYEKTIYQDTLTEFKVLTGSEFPDGRNMTLNFFKGLGLQLPKTPLGNDSVNADFLDDCDHPAAKLMVKARESEKKISTYYSSFLYLRDSSNVVRATMRQGGTETGRFSYSNPNLQNLPKEDEPEDLQKPFLVRGCFVPRPGMVYVAKDFEQQEYRMMLDYAGARKLIDAVMGGMDVHQATAELVGITRKQAKTLNFAILYGAGAEKIAKMLGTSVMEAQHLKDKYFSRLPSVEILIRKVTQKGKERGYIMNWFGRKCHVANPQWAYILPNHLIQGGCADVIKIAMNRIQEKIDIDKVPVHMLLNVHDELLFEMDPNYLSYVDDVITPIMESIYKPKNGMKLTTSSSHSYKSYSAKDMVKGLST